VFKNKHPAISQGRYMLEARGLRLKKINHRQPGFQLRASRFQPIACEHIQKPHNAGSRPWAQFFNTLLMFSEQAADIAMGTVSSIQRTHGGIDEKALSFIRQGTQNEQKNLNV
jgi:hypothetical protein